MNLGALYAEALLFKAAAPRYLREMMKNNLSGSDLQRLGGTGSAAIRRGLQTAATDLNPQQLSRHRHLQGLLGNATATFEGGALKNFRGAGPAMAFGTTHVSPQAGTMLRHTVEGRGKTVKMMGLASGKDIPSALYKHVSKPEDAGFYRSILNHERGERTMFQGVSNGSYKPNFFASHLGPTADLAERQGVRDPRVHELLDKMRTTMGKDDPRAHKLFRQAGVVAGNAPPLGGRAHRSLERRIEQMPSALGEGGAKRIAVGAPLPQYAKGLGRAQTVLDKVAPHVPVQYRDPMNEIRNTISGMANRSSQQIRNTQEDVRKHIGLFSSLSPVR